MTAAPALSTSLFTPAERETLAWVCGTLFPRLTPAAGDNAALFGADAVSLGVPAAMEEVLGSVSTEQAQDFRLLLRALDNPVFVMTLVGRPRAFRALSGEDREKLLRAMARSPVPLARKGFQGLKRLAAFLFYAVMDGRGSNPTWRALGYAPSENPPARENALTLTLVTGPMTVECDACVIGSGAGGGVAAAALAARGLSVVVLEQGPGDQAREFDQRELVGMERLYLDRATTSTRDLGVAILAGACVGGGTAVNWQTALRLPDDIRDEWSARSGLGIFTDSRFTAALDAVCARSGVGTDESVINPNNDALRRGCEALGWRWRVLPRNATGCDAAQCGHCVFGCRHGGKRATSVTYLADAQQTGRVTIIPNCRAVRVAHARGTVTGVVATGRDMRSSMGAEYRVDVRARQVYVAAGGIETPALLLRSGVATPALGANLFLHPTSAVAGCYAEPVRPWSGPPQTVMSDTHATIDGHYGVRLEAAPAHPGLLALALPWFGARSHREWMQKAGHVSALIALIRDEAGGRVRVRRDGRAAIDYKPGARELKHLRRGIAAAARVHAAAGALEVLALHSKPHVLTMSPGSSPGAIDAFCDRLLADAVDRNWSTLFSAHQMGTCRMGANPRTAVCDERGAVYGMRGLYVADASLFPASSGVNPMVSVMALAYLVTEGE